MRHEGGQNNGDRNDEPGGKSQSKKVFFTIIGIGLLIAIGAGVWWGVTTFAGTQEQEVVGAVDGYFAAGARNDREAAERFIYRGEDAQELGASDFSRAFEPETFFAYRTVVPHHFFADAENAYVSGVIEYNERPARDFTAVLRRSDNGNWGLLRLELEEAADGDEVPASMLIGSAMP